MFTMLPGLAAAFVKLLQLCLGFVAGNHFPLPLSEEEERDCLLGLKQGDMSKRNTLVEHNLRLVAHIVKKFDPNPQDVEDMISIGSIGLVKAINTYRDDKGTRLATYASRCIENEILMHLRATKNDKTELHLFDPLGQEANDGDVSYFDVVKDEEPDVEEVVIAKVQGESLLKTLSILEDKEREVLEFRYGLYGKAPKTQREIAKLLGISRSYVSRIEKRALGKLSKVSQPTLQ